MCAQQTFLDQTLVAPAMVGLFFTAMPLIEGKGFDESRARVREVRPFRHLFPTRPLIPLQNYSNTLIANWCVAASAPLAHPRALEWS
jgi:hypothetical protein